MWAYDSLDERTRRRAELAAHPQWPAYIEKIRPFLISQESKLLVPAPFFTPVSNGVTPIPPATKM
jgi:hypothetical protein